MSMFFKILIPFMLTHTLGIYAAYQIQAGPDVIAPSTIGDFTWADGLVFAAVMIVCIVISLRFRKTSNLMYRIVLTILALSGTMIIAGLWLPSIFALPLALVLIVLFWLKHNVLVHDVIMVLTFGAFGATLGLALTPSLVVGILVAMSIYDIIAVYKTRHMVAMADTMIQSRAIFGFIIPTKASGLLAPVQQVAPSDDFMILGSGDVVLPLLLSASLVTISVELSLVVTLFSAVGLFLMFILFSRQTERQPMAALPPIAMMTIIGYLIGILFNF